LDTNPNNLIISLERGGNSLLGIKYEAILAISPYILPLSTVARKYQYPLDP
jgi:hypothetical protein